MRDIFVGRQPIYNQVLDVVAYELLFRNSAENSARFSDGDMATSTLLSNTLVEIGLDKLVGDRPAYVNFTRSFLTGQDSMPFNKERLVIEILEDIEVDDELIASLKRLAAEGYRLALDDFLYEPRLRPLVELANIVKVDFRAADRDCIWSQVDMLRRYPVKLLAEKIETLEEFEFCKRLGFDYFQGYFLSRPRVIRGRSLPNNRLAVMRLLARLEDPNIDIKELEQFICQDVSLSFKLLTYINSAAIGMRQKINSIQQAVVLLGLKRLRTMVTLITLAGMDDTPPAVLNTCMVRAKMCELLGTAMRRSDVAGFFTVGLFSALDLVMDAPLDELVKDLPLADDVKQALLEYEGALGEALRCVLAYEHGEWDKVNCLQLDQAAIRDAYLKAIAWVEANTEVTQQLRSQPNSSSARPRQAVTA